jgi:peptide/nickel transport system ATP-binding protein
VVLEVKSLAKSHIVKQGLFGKRDGKAVQNVNFRFCKNTSWARWAKAASGKTTMSLTPLRLHEPTGAKSSSTARICSR